MTNSTKSSLVRPFHLPDVLSLPLTPVCFYLFTLDLQSLGHAHLLDTRVLWHEIRPIPGKISFPDTVTECTSGRHSSSTIVILIGERAVPSPSCPCNYEPPLKRLYISIRSCVQGSSIILLSTCSSMRPRLHNPHTLVRIHTCSVFQENRS